MATEYDTCIQIMGDYAREIGIVRTRYGKILLVAYWSGLYHVYEDALFSHADPVEIERFLAQTAA
jgi:hypothetical protein